PEKYTAPILPTTLSVYDAASEQVVELTGELPDQIILQPNDRFFRLGVSMVDYFNADRLSYTYRIEGWFDQFQRISGNVIEISGLPYGEYQLHVRGQRADKRYSTQELVLPIRVIRPVYYRWWFLLLLVLGLVSLIITSYNWRIKSLQARRLALEQTVKERTARIQEQAQQLQELDAVKSRFFANISHELRTPLTLLISPIEELLNEPIAPEQSRTYLQMMRRNGHKLLRRINDLLDLSKLDAQRLVVISTPTLLYPYLKTLLASFESTAQLQEISLVFEYQLPDKLTALIDRDKVEKILMNLLSNAFKFTPAGGQIKLSVSRQQGNLLLNVHDTGPGIAAEDLPKIFERYYQSAQNKQVGGTGIGLALCRELASALNGKIWATSVTQEGDGVPGSIFHLRLPLTETIASSEQLEAASPPVVLVAEKPTEEVPTQNPLRPWLLVVEDNYELREYIRLILAPDDQVVTVANGEEALARLTGNNLPRLIISDLMMPRMDGMELLQRIKADSRLQLIPFIMLTAQQHLATKLAALRIGIDDYLTKPFQASELRARVSNLIRNYESRAGEQPDLNTSDL
ncbi:MAG: ATP-binding protein, partial [Bacteroidota bacterium]